MEALFLFLYRLFEKRRTRLLLLVIGIAAVAGYLASRIRFEEDISRMISGGGSESMLTRVVDQAKFLEKIVITVSPADTSTTADPQDLITFADQLADTLTDSTFRKFVTSLTYKVSDTVVEELFNIVYSNLPLFIEERDYPHIDSALTLSTVHASIENSYRNLLSPASFTMKQMIIRDPAGIGSIALNRLRAYQNDENYTMVGNCIFSRDLQHLMMFITPVYPSNQTSKNTVFIRNFDNAIRILSARYGNRIKVEYFGSPIVAAGNAERLKKDIRLTLSITLVLLALIINFSVKKKKLFPFIFLPALFGGLIALAFLYIFNAKISVISLSIGTVILAITVDYALHITTHFKHKHSIINTIKDVSFPIMVCGIATAFEFLTLVFVSSESLHELGILAAISVVTAAFFTLVVLPHILDITRSAKDETEEKNYLEQVLDKVTNVDFYKSRILLWGMVLFSVISVFYIRKVGFETDMMKMNYMSPQLIRTENNLNRINNYKLNSVYVVAYGRNLQEALQRNEQVLKTANVLKAGGRIKSYNSPSSLLMSDSMQQQRINTWNAFWEGSKKERFLAALEQEAVNAGFRPGSFPEFTGLINKEFKPADSTVFKNLESLFFVDNITVTPELATIVTILKVDNNNKNAVVAHYNSAGGVVVIDRKSMLSQIVNTLGDDFSFIANMSMLLILTVLVFAFGRFELGFITFIPIFLSWVWTLGVMGMAGIKFNIFNIIISSFITGLGIDYSIYIMQGLVQGFKSDNKSLLSYKTCILISVMISISGTGVLILAKHPALNSIALISIIGLLSVVLISYTFEPILFYWLVKKRNRRRVVPLTFTDILATVAVFGIFIGGSVVINIMLLFVILLPVSTARKKKIMHRGMCFFSKLPVYAMFHIKKRIINLSGEDFSKPAVILSNHQSHIDLLLLLMLHPNIIVLTTKWVWNNPIYALVIRFLEFYPVMHGYDAITEQLRLSIANGYSILVYPEGTRSADGSIGRFHKGAFIMAEKLGIDLLPVFIHGAGDCMNKGENHLKAGSVTVKIYPRIGAGDAAYGNDYHERTKNMLAFYRSEYARIREELETPDYFRFKVIRNYIYKGPVLEWYTRIKLSLEDNFNLVNSLIPRDASVVDIGCGYGYMSYLLGFVSEKRHILGIDYDAEKIELAANCISGNSRIRFVAADASAFHYKKSDVFVMSDVLHYISPEKQEQLITACIQNLSPRGIIIIRDADSDLQKRHRGTRYSEFFSTRSGFNKSENNRLFFFSGKSIHEIAQKGDMKVEVVDNAKLTSNVYYILRRNHG